MNSDLCFRRCVKNHGPREKEREKNQRGGQLEGRQEKGRAQRTQKLKDESRTMTRTKPVVPSV